MAITPTRPPIVPPTGPGARGRGDDPAKLAAQKAFFDLALGKTAAASPANAAPAAPAAQSSAPPQSSASAQAGSAETPRKILRPGSLIDIRV